MKVIIRSHGVHLLDVAGEEEAELPLEAADLLARGHLRGTLQVDPGQREGEDDLVLVQHAPVQKVIWRSYEGHEVTWRSQDSHNGTWRSLGRNMKVMRSHGGRQS